MSLLTVPCVVASGCIVLVYFSRRYFENVGHSPLLPPGPPGLPWVGNVIGMNRRAPWLTFTEWGKTYGDLIYARLFGMDIIVINSEKIAKDLLENHSLNNSDRPCFVANEMCGLDFATALLPYGDRWRLQRRFHHQTYRNDAVSRFLPLQHDKGCQLLRQLFCAPEQFWQHVSEYASSVVLNSAYDYDPPSHDDAFIKTMAKVQELGGHFVRPDILFGFEAFQILLRLPAWFPGMSFKKTMATSSKITRQYVESAGKHSLQRADLSVAPFMVHDAMRNMEEKGCMADESWMLALKEAAATACLVGSHTSRSLLTTFFLMMTLSPAAQERAQAQIDTVVGKDRLPTIADRPSLPFVDAILREVLRLRPVIPLAAPHAALNDDVYNGFRIPKGAILVANVWAMAHDGSRFPDPYAFVPERFLNEDGSLTSDNVEHIAYGFGRRICVGRHFADASLWAVIAKVLAVFKILKPLDKNGLEITIEPQFSTGGFSIHPIEFPCWIVPRVPGMDSKKLEELISASNL